jgi:hypothetical protein
MTQVPEPTPACIEAVLKVFIENANHYRQDAFELAIEEWQKHNPTVPSWLAPQVVARIIYEISALRRP